VSALKNVLFPTFAFPTIPTIICLDELSYYIKFAPVMFINSYSFKMGMAFQQTTENPIKHRFLDFGMDRIEIASWVIRVRDAYNLSYLYQMIHDWLVEEDWAPREEEKFPETYFLQRENPTSGKEIWLRWRLTKSPSGAGPKAGLFSFMMDLDWKIVGLKDTEIAWKGQKVKADRSEFELTCRAALVIDKNKEWKSWPFSQLKDVFTKRVQARKVLMHKKSIYSDAYRLRDLVMGYLKLETFMPVKEQGEMYLKRTLE